MPALLPLSVYDQHRRLQEGTGGGVQLPLSMSGGIGLPSSDYDVPRKKAKLSQPSKIALNYAQDYIGVDEDYAYASDLIETAWSTETTGVGAVVGGVVGAVYGGPSASATGAATLNQLEKMFVKPEHVTAVTNAKKNTYKGIESALDYYSKNSFFSELKQNILETPGRIAYLLGMGDYTLATNSLVKGGGAVSQGAKIIPNGNRSVRIIYKEYLGDVYTHPTTAGAFNLAAYPLNPGLVQTFPWLATIAQQYEQWTPNGIAFEFKSTSSEYVSTQALGSVIMSTEYDVYDEPYANKQEMLNSCYSNEAKPSEHIVHGVECDARDNPLSIFYCRTGANNDNASGNLRETDLGIFYIATQGGATANLNLGSLYIVYDITLRKEQMFNGVRNKGLILDCIYGTSGVTNATPLPVRSANNTVPNATEIMTIGGLGTTIILPTWINGGIWRVSYFFESSALILNLVPPSFTATSGCTAITTSYEGITNLKLPEHASSAEQTKDCFTFQDFEIASNVGSGAVIGIAGGTPSALATPSRCVLQIYQIGNGFEI